MMITMDIGINVTVGIRNIKKVAIKDKPYLLPFFLDYK